MAEGLAETRRFEQAMQWQLNDRKSAQFANSAGLRRWLAARTPAIPARPEFRDLGARAVAGPARRAPVTPARMALAAGRFGRIAPLPASFGWRCRLAAAAGAAAGLYGAACGIPPLRDLEILRRAARTAVCRGGW